MFPLEVRGEIYHEESGVTGLVNEDHRRRLSIISTGAGSGGAPPRTPMASGAGRDKIVGNTLQLQESFDRISTHRVVQKSGNSVSILR